MQDVALTDKAYEFAKKDCEGKDPSHDFYHVKRVAQLALVIAKAEGVEDLELIEIAAALHDVKDYKYGGSDDEAQGVITQFLRGLDYPHDKTAKVVEIITRLGFKKELSRDQTEKEVFLELAVVQDADRLDAIGAFGIARVFSFGAIKSNPIYDPTSKPRENLTEEQYVDKGSAKCTVNHFYEKLLKLKDLMRTKTGIEMAEKRHKFMEDYLAQLFEEQECKT